MRRLQSSVLLALATIALVMVVIGIESSGAIAAEVPTVESGIEVPEPSANLSQQDFCGTTGIAAEFGHAGGSGLWDDIQPKQENCIDVYACHTACNPGGCWQTCWYVGRICFG